MITAALKTTTRRRVMGKSIGKNSYEIQPRSDFVGRSFWKWPATMNCGLFLFYEDFEDWRRSFAM